MAFLDCFNERMTPELNSVPRIGFTRSVVRMSSRLKDYLKTMAPPGFVQWRKPSDTPFILPIGNTPLRMRLDLHQLEDRMNPVVNPIVAENLLPGNPQSEWDIVGSGDTTLQGYATDISVNRGETVNFKINDLHLAPYRIDIYRMGYYGGMGARKVATISSANTGRISQPAPLVDEAHGLVDAGNWSVAASWQVPATAVSGIYFARLTREDTGGASHIIFIVRDDTSRSDILFQTSDTTWQAYNNWGGNSVYVGSSSGGMSLCGCGFFPSANRGYAVSYNRPFATRSATPHGRDFVFGAEYPMVRWLEANGYNVSYFSGVDTARRGAELLEHKTFMTVGHDEYWSGGQRANVEAARDAGVNMMFLAGNDVYWRTRWQNLDNSPTDYRTMLVYKETFSGGDITPELEWTGTWRDPRFSPPNIGGGLPENALTGTIFTVNRGPGGEFGTAFTVPAEFAPLRLWRNTSVANLTGNQTLSLGDRVLGYEWNEDLDNGYRPAGLIPMSSTTQTVPEKILDYGATVGVGTATHSLTLYRAKSGALVFSAGTVQWSWGLDGTHDGGPTAIDSNMRQATANLLADMGVQGETLQPGLVRPVISTDIVGPTVAITSPLNNAVFTAGVPVTITGTATDTGGGVVAVVEVSTDGGRTWHRATGRNNWTYTWTPTESGPTGLRVRASDDSANLGAVAGISVTVQYTATSATGRVAAFNFNAGSGSTLADSSGNGNNGTISGATWTTGKYGNALLFNGSSSYVNIPDAASLRLTTGMTLEAWVRPTTLSSYNMVVMKETTGGQVYSLYASDSDGTPSSYVRVGSIDQQSLAPQALPLNTWSHVAATYNGSQLNTYVNGVLVASANVSGSIVTSSGALRIGGNNIWGEYFNGVIDDVRIYNRALTPAELRVDLSTPVGGTLDTTAPTGAIAAPGNGSNVSGLVPVSVTASDNALVAGVQLLVNGSPVGNELTAAPYTSNWGTTVLPNGSYTLSARIRDVAGNSFTTPAVTVTVANPADTINPTVTLLGPGDGTRVSGSTVLWAHAADNVQVAGVQFKVNGVNVGSEVTSAPYRLAWNSNGYTDGQYAITAVARDVAGNLTTTSSWTLAVDNTVPVVTSRTPIAGATSVPINTVVTAVLNEIIDLATVALVIRDPGSNVIPGSTEFDDATFTLTFTPAFALNLTTTYTVTLNAKDVAGNPLTQTVWTFSTSNSVTTATIFAETDTPEVPFNPDSALEVGVRFQTVANGYISGVRFYKGAGSTGTHTGHLWTAGGTLLGTVTFANETASGWQQANFANPISVTANTTYVVSYFAPNGGYSLTAQAFATNGAGTNGIRALSTPESGGNGVFSYGASGGFPNQSFNSTNYWVDAVFSSSLVDTTPPTVLSRTPAAGATAVAQTSTVTATLSESVQQATISFVLRDPSNNTVPASVTYNDATHLVTLTPSSPLSPFTTYTATLSGAADAAGNVMSSVSWSFTTGGPDTTPATVTSRSPAVGATNVAPRGSVSATFSEPVQFGTITFTLRDPSNSLVTATVRYTEATMTVSLSPNADLSPSTAYTATLSGVQDLAGNVTSTVTWTFTTAALITNASLWNNSLTPEVVTASDTAAVEVGMKFRVTADGYLTGMRFYKGAGNTGPHLGHLWDAVGNLLGTVTFTNESGSGWQQANFASAVVVNAGATYVISYYAPNGGYSYTANYFTADVTVGPIVGLNSATAGGNGVYRYVSGGGFPDQAFGSTNYLVDVVYANTRSDIAPPTLTAHDPANGDSGVATTTAVTATFSEDVQAATIAFELRDSLGNLVPATVTYNPATRVVTLAPASALATGGTYTATMSGARDLAGNTMDTVAWTFQTVTGPSFFTLWNAGDSPAVTSSSDTGAVELGMRFRSAVNGFITGARFYKGSGNTGTHTGRLWTSTGTLLATGTFTGESASGWQQLTFASPVAITANTTYVVSYYAPVGRYAFTAGYFNAGAVTRGSLTALAASDGGNGVYRYGTGGVFPTNTYFGGNYWVDVVFTNSLGDNTAPTVTTRTPAVNATGVATTTPITVTFSEDVQAATIVFQLRNPSNNLVPGTVAYNAATYTATFTPNATLAALTTYTATVSGAADPSGNTMTTVNWSFTTRGEWTSTTATDFAGGTTSGVQVTDEGGGRLRLSAFRDDFSGSVLSGTNWLTQNWNGSAQYTVTGGEASVAGGMIRSATAVVGKSVEGRVQFGASAYQHFGLATSVADVAGNSWAMFSTAGSTSTLYARVNVNGVTQQVTIGSLSTAYQLYRVRLTATAAEFFINDALVATVTANLSTTSMRLMASDYSGAVPLRLDWATILDHPSTGTFMSATRDAGQTVTAQSVSWTANTPAGTAIAVEVSSSADGVNWSSWTAVTNGGTVTGVVGRYLRYRTTFSTTDSALTPWLDDLTFLYV